MHTYYFNHINSYKLIIISSIHKTTIMCNIHTLRNTCRSFYPTLPFVFAHGTKKITFQQTQCSYPEGIHCLMEMHNSVGQKMYYL